MLICVQESQGKRKPDARIIRRPNVASICLYTLYSIGLNSNNHQATSCAKNQQTAFSSIVVGSSPGARHICPGGAPLVWGPLHLPALTAAAPSSSASWPWHQSGGLLCGETAAVAAQPCHRTPAHENSKLVSTRTASWHSKVML